MCVLSFQANEYPVYVDPSEYPGAVPNTRSRACRLCNWLTREGGQGRKKQQLNMMMLHFLSFLLCTRPRIHVRSALFYRLENRLRVIMPLTQL